VSRLRIVAYDIAVLQRALRADDVGLLVDFLRQRLRACKSPSAKF
jgi:hypothetical protein